MIQKKFNRQDQVTICHKHTCVNATGKYAEAIAATLVVAILFVATAFLLKRLNNN